MVRGDIPMTAGAQRYVARARATATLAALTAAAVAPLLPGAAGAAANATAQQSLVRNTASSCTAPFTTMVSPASSELLSTAAISASNVWAVGIAGRTAVTMNWNGTAWKVIANRGPKTSALWGVAGSAANNVWAVGANASKSYTEHWDGTTWSTKVNPAPASSSLSAVSTISTASAWAVGYSYAASGAGGGYTPLVEHWNGHVWAISPIAVTGTLEGVVAINAKDVWAVGEQTFGAPGGSFTGGALVLNWNGSTWTQYAVPDSSAQLTAVSADSAADVWAVGTGPSGAVAEHWTGKSWASVPTPAVTSGSLHGVVAVSPTSAWAVGDDVSMPSLSQVTLAEHWNGISWAVVASQSTSSPTNALESVAATSGGASLWAVGMSSTSTSQGVVEAAC
jgi:hypothetical protein